MSQYLPELLTVILIHFLAVVSPGPDFAVVAKNSLVHNRKVGIYTAFGISIGICVHVFYSLIGIGLIISQSVVLFSTIKLIGAAYLIYIGIKALRSKANTLKISSEKTQKTPSAKEAIKIGFLTNALNPKATIFFLAVFTQVIDPSTPKSVQVIYGLVMFINTFLLFTLISIGLSQKMIKKQFSKFQHHIERTMGAILIGLGIKIAISKD
ncbi:LysE family translocator [Candidatus Gracilibacteria bacterium]|nr:LysE family translocator [Candidatus Gracilibacteria bacterium]